MLRTSAYRVDRWCDKTMSVLREQQLEACQERLTGCPERGVFDEPSAEKETLFPIRKTAPGLEEE